MPKTFAVQMVSASSLDHSFRIPIDNAQPLEMGLLESTVNKWQRIHETFDP